MYEYHVMQVVLRVHIPASPDINIKKPAPGTSIKQKDTHADVVLGEKKISMRS